MSIQRSQNHKRQSKSNSEWLDEMINIIDRMKNKLQNVIVMGFPHCPICVALAFFTFCVVVTRSYMLFFLYNESLKRRSPFLPIPKYNLNPLQRSASRDNLYLIFLLLIVIFQNLFLLQFRLLDTQQTICQISKPAYIALLGQSCLLQQFQEW